MLWLVVARTSCWGGVELSVDTDLLGARLERGECPSEFHIPFGSMHMSSSRFECAFAMSLFMRPCNISVVVPRQGQLDKIISSSGSNGKLAPKSGTSSITEELLFEVLHRAPKGRSGL